jgi:hypothetical protein
MSYHDHQACLAERVFTKRTFGVEKPAFVIIGAWCSIGTFENESVVSLLISLYKVHVTKHHLSCRGNLHCLAYCLLPPFTNIRRFK